MISLSRPHPEARYVVPEVVQTSMMDCGPAALLALVSGFGMSINYGRLREACQTSVDGTSITTMDEIANLLGLDTEEMMLPADHLLLADAHALPAIVVVTTPNGSNHFVVLWSIAGPWVQIMDPAEGRQWILRSTLFERLYIHQAKVPASAWRAWAGEQEFLSVLDARLAALGIDRPDRERLCAGALASPRWAPMAALDAATRMTASLVENGAVSRGALCLTLIERQVQPREGGSYPLIAGEYRSVWKAPVQDSDEEEMLIVRGVVLVRALGLRDRGRRVGDVAVPEGAADGKTVVGTADQAEAANARGVAVRPEDATAASAVTNGAAGGTMTAAVFTAATARTSGAHAQTEAAAEAEAAAGVETDAETDAAAGTDAEIGPAISAGAEIEAAAGAETATEPTLLSPELAAALTEESVRPWRTLVGMLVEDGLLTPLVLGLVLVLSAALITADAILLRGLLEVGQQLGLPSQRAAAMAGLVGFLALGLFVELPLIAGALRLGRTLDLRLRMAFLAKIPRLDDRYFRSRLLSDMAERGHSLHLVRGLPRLGVRLLAASAQLLLTVGGIAWLQPESALFALVAAVFCIGVPLACQPLMAERDLRLRSHAGALGRFYLDALIGLLPIRVHGARAAMQHQQESLLVSWARAGLRYYAAATLVEGALGLCGLGMAVLMVWSVSSHSSAGLLLLVYWALSLPALGQDIAIVARQYPVMRNVVSRLLEPLGTPEPIEPAIPASAALRALRDDDRASEPRGAAIRMANVSVEAAGNTVLEQVDLELAPGEHVAIVGPSGAGKSTLVGLLLGWYRPAVGSVEVDGRPLVGEWLRSLRRVTAWVDPAVALWNRSFLDNLRYGAGDGELPLAEILSRARLREVLEHLPDGLTTELGEGGALISGGEGQRTRVGRALARTHARLIVLDEPFRGLDLTTRRELLAMARDWWRDATLLWVTHDIAETEQFDRVLVIDNGRIVEDGDPGELSRRPGSRYASLVRGDHEMHEREWSGDKWRRVWIERGKVREELGS